MAEPTDNVVIEETADQTIAHDQGESGQKENYQRPQLPFFGVSWKQSSHGSIAEYGFDYTGLRYFTAIFYRQLDKDNNPIKEPDPDTGELVDILAYPIAMYVTTYNKDLSSRVGKDAYVLGVNLDDLILYLERMVWAAKRYGVTTQMELLKERLEFLRKKQPEDPDDLWVSSDRPYEAIAFGSRYVDGNGKHIDWLDLNADYFLKLMPDGAFPIGPKNRLMHQDIIDKNTFPRGHLDTKLQEWIIEDRSLNGHRHRENDATLKITFNKVNRFVNAFKKTNTTGSNTQKPTLMGSFQNTLNSARKNKLGMKGWRARRKAVHNAARAFKRCHKKDEDGNYDEANEKFCKIGEELLDAAYDSAVTQNRAYVKKLKKMKPTDPRLMKYTKATIGNLGDIMLLDRSGDTPSDDEVTGAFNVIKDKMEGKLDVSRGELENTDHGNERAHRRAVGKVLNDSATVALVGGDSSSGTSDVAESFMKRIIRIINAAEWEPSAFNRAMDSSMMVGSDNLPPEIKRQAAQKNDEYIRKLTEEGKTDSPQYYQAELAKIYLGGARIPPPKVENQNIPKGDKKDRVKEPENE